MKKKLTKENKIFAEVDDEVYLLMKRIEFKHDLSWAKARDLVNHALRV